MRGICRALVVGATFASVLLVGCSFDVPEPTFGEAGEADAASEARGSDATAADGSVVPEGSDVQVDARGDSPDSTVGDADATPTDSAAADASLDAAPEAQETGSPEAGVEAASDAAADAIPDQTAPDGPVDAPTEACALTMCGGACVDLSSDPYNCGRCGRACRTPRFPAGACAGGGCNIPSAIDGPSYLYSVSVDPYASPASAVYAPGLLSAQENWASVVELQLDGGSPSGQGTQITVTNAVMADYEVPAQGTLVAVGPVGLDSPIQCGYWNGTLFSGPTAKGGLLSIAFDPSTHGATVYYSQAATGTTDAGLTTACLYDMSTSALTAQALGCLRTSPTASASPAVAFQISSDGQRVYLLTQDDSLDLLDVTTGARTLIPYGGGGLTPQPLAGGLAVDASENYLYYFTLDTTALYVHQYKLSNAVDVVVATLPGEFPQALLADAANVYVATATSGGTLLVRWGPSSSSPSLVNLGSLPMPSSFIANGWGQTPNEIFFALTNQTSAGSVYRVAKP